MPPIRDFTATRRNLPHWQQPGSVYFLTWRVVPGRQLEPDDRTLALNAVRFWHGRRWFVYTAVVMPDHVHVLARPLQLDPSSHTDPTTHDLGELLHSVKSYSSNVINRRQGLRGTLWQDERYDRIVRDDREFEETWQYIRHNPVEAGLAAMPEEYPWRYESSVVE